MTGSQGSSAFFDGRHLRWLVGIEDTCVYPPEGSAMGELDEHRLTGHDEHWREDLAAAARLGASGIRYGVSWPRICAAPGRFDWHELDERLAFAVEELGLVVVADLVHYGTPTWLGGSFADPDYPDAVADLAGEFATRYRGLVDHLTPLNEPVTTASFCGLRGVWPPNLTGWEGWTTVTMSIVEGIRRSTTRIRAANADAVVMHVEAATLYKTDDPALADEVELLTRVGRLPTDLLTGRVDGAHPMRSWLERHGADADLLATFVADPVMPDLLGVNYYPDLTPRRVERQGGGSRQVTVNRWTDGLEVALRDAAQRYELPVVVTETSVEGDEALRSAWAADSMSAVRRLAADGVDVRGYTWWPLLDFVDWSYASGGRNVEEFVLDPDAGVGTQGEMFGAVEAGPDSFLRRMGLLHLAPTEADPFTRVAGRAAEAFATRTADAGAGDVVQQPQEARGSSATSA